jgi:hypothetical protein
MHGHRRDHRRLPPAVFNRHPNHMIRLMLGRSLSEACGSKSEHHGGNTESVSRRVVSHDLSLTRGIERRAPVRGVCGA